VLLAGSEAAFACGAGREGPRLPMKGEGKRGRGTAGGDGAAMQVTCRVARGATARPTGHVARGALPVRHSHRQHMHTGRTAPLDPFLYPHRAASSPLPPLRYFGPPGAPKAYLNASGVMEKQHTRELPASTTKRRWPASAPPHGCRSWPSAPPHPPALVTVAPDEKRSFDTECEPAGQGRGRRE
jgi:hypothetical protein